MKKSFRYRLPDEFLGLKPNVGAILRRARKTSAEHGEMSMEAFASMVGLPRETLSRIENDHRWPSIETLTKLMACLELRYEDVADIDPNFRLDVREDTPQDLKSRNDLGNALRIGRRNIQFDGEKRGMSLKQLSEHTGISESQISRIERSLSGGSKRVGKKFADGNKELDEDTIFWFTHPVLEYLSELGGYERTLGRIVTRYPKGPVEHTCSSL